MENDTIVALSSGALPSGVAVLRISGPAALAALQRVAGPPPEGRRAGLRTIRDASGTVIDRGIVLFFEGPRTVTGEHLAEIHLHGGRAVVAACLDALLATPGLRLAQTGEFTRQAFENGRIDLTEAEGLADLLAAETEAQRIRAVAGAGGSLKALYEGWMAQLVRARALLEASFDFADEGDVGEDVDAAVRPALIRLAAEMRAHLSGAARGEILRNGFRVAIIGPPNAGKSSLLNALADRDVAIVSAIPGTTRDVIEVTLDLGGVPVRFFDTAGIRETDDQIEAIGVERALKAMREADLVLRLAAIDQASDVAPMYGNQLSEAYAYGEAMAVLQPTLDILTKADLSPETAPRFGTGTTALSVSSQTGEGLAELVDRISQIAKAATGDPAALVPTRARHREIVSDALALLDSVLAEDQPAEIVAEALRRTTNRLGALTGRVGVENLLDVIFSEFCIGK